MFSPMSCWSIGSIFVTAALMSSTFKRDDLLAAEREELGRQGGRALGRLADRIDAAQRAVGVEIRPSGRREILGEELGVAVDGEEHVVEVVGDAPGKPADRFELLRLEELVLCCLALADVADRGRDEDPFGAVERAQHDLDRELGAVLASGGELDPGPDLLGEGVGRRAEVVRDEPLGEALRDDVRHLLPDELVAQVAELFLGLEVEQDDLAGLVDHDHCVRRRFQQPAVPRLGVAPRLAPGALDHAHPTRRSRRGSFVCATYRSRATQSLDALLRSQLGSGMSLLTRFAGTSSGARVCAPRVRLAK
jgi:hypothetical protein